MFLQGWIKQKIWILDKKQTDRITKTRQYGIGSVTISWKVAQHNKKIYLAVKKKKI